MADPNRPSSQRPRAGGPPQATPAAGYRQGERVRESLQAQRAEVDAPVMAGRGLPGRKGPAAPPQPQPQGPASVGGMLVAGPGGTPFAASQVDVGTNIAPSSANSFQVMTIVGGISAMIVLMLMASLIVIVVGYLGWVGRRLDGDAVAKDKGHKRDTGLVDEIDPDALVRRGRKGGKGVAAEPVAGDPLAEMFGGIGGAPVTVYAKGKYSDTYHGIEVFCDRVPGFRERQSLSAPQADGRRKAHIPIIPATRCRLVFQGNVPVRTYVTGGDVVTCTFDPIVCK